MNWENGSAIVNGKGSKQREVYFTTEYKVWLSKYLKSREDFCKALFVTIIEEEWAMLGLPKGEVFLIPWTNEWVKEFTNESEKITSELGELVHAVHHVGSTAVKNLSAKPIIDIAIELKEFDHGQHCIHGLERLGYEYKGTEILPERHYFIKGEPRTHQIHMFEKGNKYLMKQLAFRDYLLNDSEALNKYLTLKETLSRTHQSDKIAYSHAKTDFINTIMEKLGFN